MVMLLTSLSEGEELSLSSPWMVPTSSHLHKIWQTLILAILHLPFPLTPHPIYHLHVQIQIHLPKHLSKLQVFTIFAGRLFNVHPTLSLPALLELPSNCCICFCLAPLRLILPGEETTCGDL